MVACCDVRLAKEGVIGLRLRNNNNNNNNGYF